MAFPDIMADWIRVTYFLPVTTRNDRTAYLRTLDYLRTMYPQIRGCTYTQDDPPTIHGYYWSNTRQNWIPDSIAVIVIDRPDSPGKSTTLREEAQSLKVQIEQSYEEEGSVQEEVWCTTQSIDLVV